MVRTLRVLHSRGQVFYTNCNTDVKDIQANLIFYCCATIRDQVLCFNDSTYMLSRMLLLDYHSV